MAKRVPAKKEVPKHPWGHLPITPINNSDAEFNSRMKSGQITTYTMTKEEIALKYPPKQKSTKKEDESYEILVETCPETDSEISEDLIEEEILHIY